MELGTWSSDCKFYAKPTTDRLPGDADHFSVLIDGVSRGFGFLNTVNGYPLSVQNSINFSSKSASFMWMELLNSVNLFNKTWQLARVDFYRVVPTTPFTGGSIETD